MIVKHSIRHLFILSFVVVLTALPGEILGQTHGDHVMIQAGVSYPSAMEGTLAYEHETDYHSAWEYFGSYYLRYEKDKSVGHITNESFWHTYNTWNVGIAYKPCVTRGRNHHGNLRIGVSGGSDLDHAIGMAHIGYEHTYNLYNGWAVFFQVKEDVGIRMKDTFRTGAYIGVKIPL